METNRELEIEGWLRKQIISHGYPAESIERISNKMELPGDIAIKNGTRYVQCFELKTNGNRELRKNFFSQYVSLYKVQLPVYLVTKEKNDIVIYGEDSPIPLDKESVLNYEKATDSFVESTKKEIKKGNRCFKIVCYILSVLFFILDMHFFVKNMSCPSYDIATISFAVLMMISYLIPFLKNFEVKVGDLGLNLTFQSESHHHVDKH